MPAWAATLAVGIATVVCNALLTAFYYGRLSERVDGHTEKIQQHQRSFEANTEEQRDQWSKINDLREDVGKVRGKLGVNGE